jgi:hypothetical protein
LDLDAMIHNLETERKRIEEALEVLRRLHQMRKPSSSEPATYRELTRNELAGSRADQTSFRDNAEEQVGEKSRS